MVLDMLLHNFRTCLPWVDPAKADAHRALGVMGDRIVGLDDDVRALRATTVVDCRGAYLSPGFGDAHNHMGWFGLSLAEVDLSGCRSLSEVHDQVAARANLLPADAWVIGAGYDHSVLGSHPDRDSLDRAGGGRPVWLKHRSGHLCVVSSVILDRAGVLTGDEPVPEGGSVVREANGRATGVLRENAQELVTRQRGPVPLDELVDAISAASRVYAAQGLTHVVECGIGGGLVGRSPLEALAYQIAQEEGRLDVRVDLMPAADILRSFDGEDVATLDLGLRTGFGDDQLRLGPVKVWLDGSLLGRTAAVSEPYCDGSGDTGSLMGEPEVLRGHLVQAHRAGWRLAMHAIGDRAIDLALDVVEEAQRVHPRRDVRHRIEHAALVRPDQLSRISAAGIVPVPQPRFLYDIGDDMFAAVGPDRSHWLYRHASFLAEGVRVPGSSDRPVAEGAPLLGMQSMVERMSASGRQIGSGEVVDGSAALKAYTEDEAWTCHDEHRRGGLARGMLADFVLLSDDPANVESSNIGRTDVLATVMGGRLTFVSDQLGAIAMEGAARRATGSPGRPQAEQPDR